MSPTDIQIVNTPGAKLDTTLLEDIVDYCRARIVGASKIIVHVGARVPDTAPMHTGPGSLTYTIEAQYHKLAPLRITARQEVPGGATVFNQGREYS